MTKIQPKHDIVGKKYNRLTVIEYHSLSKYGDRLWKCKCDCGKECVIRGQALKSGNNKSCGCMYLERITQMGKSKKKHGMKFTKEYSSWSKLKSRCYNPKDPDFHNYGGRGIMVCDRWINSFENFFEDMGYAPSKKHSMDRFPDMNGIYEKSNCRWATSREQSLNRRVTVFENIDGLVMCRSDAATYINISPETYMKYHRLGYSAQEIKDIFSERQKDPSYRKQYKDRFNK